MLNVAGSYHTRAGTFTFPILNDIFVKNCLVKYRRELVHLFQRIGSSVLFLIFMVAEKSDTDISLK